jgi:ABC-2 type transport system ATP-binding protein
MRQRLALAAALLGDPPVLLLDEPTTGLDLYGVGWLRAQLRHWADQGRAVLVASHSLTELAPVVDEVLVLADGRLLAHQPAATLAAPATTGPTPASTPTLPADLHTALLRLLATQPATPPTKERS